MYRRVNRFCATFPGSSPKSRTSPGWRNGWRDSVDPPRNSSRQQILAGLSELFKLRDGPGLDVAPNQRLGAAGAEGHPFTVRQQEFIPVGGDELLHPVGTN